MTMQTRRAPRPGRLHRGAIALVVARAAAPWSTVGSWPGAPVHRAAVPADRPTTARRRTALDLGVLAALGIAIVALALRMARWPALPAHPESFGVVLLGQLALYGLAAGWVLARQPASRGALALVFLVALAARLAFVAQAPTASDDIYRYVWDGRIQASGINPYRYAPDDPALAGYRDEAIYPGINRKPVPTIYPPVAQAVFRGIYRLHPDSVAWTKLALIGVDLLAIGVIAGLLPRLGLRPERALLYAWHPLLILELGHSGHVDVVAVLFLLLAVRARVVGQPVQAGALLACATLVKFYAVAALPALLGSDRRRAWWRDLGLLFAFIATGILAYLPFLSVGTKVFGYLPGYVQEEGIASGGRFYLLHQLGRLAASPGAARPRWLAGWPLGALSPAGWYQLFLVAALGTLAVWCWLRARSSPRDIATRAALLFVALFALATPSQPWYTLLVLAFVPLVGRGMLPPASLVVGTAGFGYLHWWLPTWPAWPLAVSYGGRAAALALIAGCAVLPPLARRARRRSHGAAGAVGPPMPMPAAPATQHVDTEPASLFDHFPWVYAFCRERLFRDHSAQIATALWPEGTPPAGSQLLELGCGPGFYARRFATRFPYLRVTGIDRSGRQLCHARSRAATRRLDNCRFEQGDVRHLARPTDSVDTVVASRLFTILPERERALAEMHRVLRPGGRCFIAEPRAACRGAAPLRILWLVAGLAALGGGGRRAYREPRAATVLSVEEFGALIGSQPWGGVRCWHSAQYHYAVCSKGAAGSTPRGADWGQWAPGPSASGAPGAAGWDEPATAVTAEQE